MTALIPLLHQGSSLVTLNEDLNLTSNCSYTWKMYFNPDPSKQVKEITFSKKRSDTQMSVLIFNKKPKRLENSQL